jgi:peptidoglycan-associated lipoprotein
MKLTNLRIDEFGSRMRITLKLSIALLVVLVVASACAKKQTPVLAPVAPPPIAAPPEITTAKPPAPPTRVDEALPVPPQPLIDDEISNRTLDDLNRNSPLTPVFFAVDSADLDEAARAAASENADLMRKYTSWVVTVEGHCDETGSPEYNLALGERRAVAVKTFLVSLGVPPDRIRTVSYGKEFPFDPGRTEEAYARNRRGHFVITSN